MKNFTIHVLMLLVLASSASAKNKPTINYNVKDYGATGDGVTLDSKAINKVIDAAAAVGGGTVYLPAGNYLSGSIHLKSHIALFIDQGGTIGAAPGSPDNG